MGIYANSALSEDDDAYKSPLQQIPEGLGLIANSIGQGASGLYDQLSQGASQGLGLMRQGLDAITPSQDTMTEIAMRLQNANAVANGGTPLWMQQQQHQLALGQHEELMNMKRQQLAQQLQQQQEAKRQHDMGLLEKVMASPKASIMLSHLAEDPNFTMAPQALSLSKALKDSDFGSMQTYREFIPEDVQKQFLDGKLPHEHLVAWIDQARDAAKENAKAAAKSAVLSRAMNKDAGSRSPYEQSLVEEHQAEIETNNLKRQKIQSEILENNAQALKAQHDATHPKQANSVRNDIALAFHGKPYEELTRGGPEQKDVMNRYQSMYAQGRQDVQQSAPVPVKERSDVVEKKAFLQSGALNRPAAGISQGAMAKGDYIQMSDQQQKDAQQIEQAKENLTSLMSLVTPHITAKTPAEAAKQFIRLNTQAYMGTNPDLATFKSGSEAFSSVFARVFGGEVGVMTDRDINRWKATLPTFGDTQQTAQKKQELFFKLYDTAVMKFRKRIAGEDTSGENKQIEGLLSQADKVNVPEKAPSLKGMPESELQKKRKELFK